MSLFSIGHSSLWNFDPLLPSQHHSMPITLIQLTSRVNEPNVTVGSSPKLELNWISGNIQTTTNKYKKE